MFTGFLTALCMLIVLQKPQSPLPIEDKVTIGILSKIGVEYNLKLDKNKNYIEKTQILSVLKINGNTEEYKITNSPTIIIEDEPQATISFIPFDKLLQKVGHQVKVIEGNGRAIRRIDIGQKRVELPIKYKGDE